MFFFSVPRLFNSTYRKSITLPWVPEGFFFHSEAAIVSGEAAIVILPREKKKTLWMRQLQTSLPCELVSILVDDWSLYLVPSLFT